MAAAAPPKVAAVEKEAPHGNVSLGFRPPKAYKDPTFLSSKAARTIRILCEYEQPGDKLKEHGIKGTILFFGSARSKNREEWDAAKVDADARVAAETLAVWACRGQGGCAQGRSPC